MSWIFNDGIGCDPVMTVNRIGLYEPLVASDLYLPLSSANRDIGVVITLNNEQDLSQG